MTKKSIHLAFLSVYTLITLGLITYAQLAWNVVFVLLALPVLYLLFETKIYTNDSKVKIAQAFAYIGSLLTLIFAWNLKLFLFALFCGWLLFGIGVSICLHKWASHRTFTPRNQFWKTVILWFGSMCTLGSTISWAAGHREHHRFTDKQGDPHSPSGSLWHKIKVYFYYFPTYPISPMLIKDLTIDTGHKWFHKHYYKVIYSYALGLFLIDPIYAGYFYCLPVLYVFTGISWVTVIAHLPYSGRWGYRSDTYRIYKSDDYTYNSHVWQFLLMGEGYHNTHHTCPWLWNNAMLPKEFDISGQIIKRIGNVNDRPPLPFDSVRRGQEMFDEIHSVSVKNRTNNKLEVPNPT
jgi:stearoyl-CoA desaturase (delta-9 desaturase)